MTPEQEQAVEAALAEGLSTRAAAKQAGVPPTSVQRVRDRLGKQAAPPAEPTAAGQDTEAGPPEPQEDDDEGGALADAFARAAAGRAELLEALARFEARAEASRQAKTALEQERLDLLASGRDAAPLRGRIASADGDLRDSEDSAALVRKRIGELDRQLADARKRQEWVRKTADLETRIGTRAETYASTYDEQLAGQQEVERGAERYTRAVQAEREQDELVNRLAVNVAALAAQLGEPAPVIPPVTARRLQGEPGATSGPSLAMTRAYTAAQAANTAAVAAELGAGYGFKPVVPPTAEEQAEWQRRREAMQAEEDRLRAAQQAGPGGPGAGSEDLDEHGRVVPVRYVNAPSPLDVYRAPSIFGGGSYGPGYRSGW